jgi:hypothetical protein
MNAMIIPTMTSYCQLARGKSHKMKRFNIETVSFYQAGGPAAR